MKPATSGVVATLLGLLALVTHVAIGFMTLLGAGLASTPDTPAPQRAETLWGMALWGTPLAALAFFLLLVNWSKPAALAYAGIWLALLGFAIGGWMTYPDDATIPTGMIIVQTAIPVASIAVALYGVWCFRATTP